MRISGLSPSVAIEIVPPSGLPARARRATVTREAERLSKGVPNADRPPRAPLRRDEIDHEHDLRRESRRRFAVLGRGEDHGATGVSPWRRITSAIAARSGGPAVAASRIAATSRK